MVDNQNVDQSVLADGSSPSVQSASQLPTMMPSPVTTQEGDQIPAGAVVNTAINTEASLGAVPSLEAIKLPVDIVSRSDVSKSLRDLELIDDFFHQSAIRGSKDQPLPAIGKALDSLTEVNELNLLKAEDRQVLKLFLRRLKANAPVVHVSFPSKAGSSFLMKVIEWFRNEVHPHTLLNVGLQPDLVAGFTLRTTNKVYDFSFRKKFEASKGKLLASIAGSSEAVVASEPQPSVASNPQPEVVASVESTDATNEVSS